MEKPFLKNKYVSIKEFVFNYPDENNYLSWLAILNDWLKKNRTNLYTKTKKVLTITYVMQIVKSFNALMLNDILFNHVIFAFPGNKLFMFIAQVSENSKSKKLYFSNGMYNLRVCIYYVSTTRKKATFKYIYFMGLYKNSMMKALVDGHKYPRQEDVIDYINTQIYG